MDMDKDMACTMASHKSFVCMHDWHVVVAFSSHVRIWGECSTIHSPPALFFFKVEISSCRLLPLFRPGSVHSSSAS